MPVVKKNSPISFEKNSRKHCFCLKEIKKKKRKLADQEFFFPRQFRRLSKIYTQ